MNKHSLRHYGVSTIVPPLLCAARWKLGQFRVIACALWRVQCVPLAHLVPLISAVQAQAHLTDRYVTASILLEAVYPQQHTHNSTLS